MDAEETEMTKASAARVARRGRGRPPRDYSPDVEVAEWAIALQAAWGMSERAAIDLALTICQGEAGPPTKIPRGAKEGGLVGYRLPMERTFHSRSADIRRTLKAGKLQPDHAATLAIARLLLRIRRLAPLAGPTSSYVRLPDSTIRAVRSLMGRISPPTRV
jgi:hypothetical protein